MYHSITIGEKNTWNDWHLIPTTRPLFNPPNVKTYEIDIPGSDGVIDLTSSLTGKPTYSNRKGSWTFIVENGHGDWQTLYSNIMAYLHGQKYIAILEDDPDYYYEGRFSVNSWKSDKNWSQIVIDYNVFPYKKDVSASGSDWLWDSFNFETGVIRNYKNLSVVDTLTVTITASSNESVPIIIASESGMTVTYNGTVYNLIKGVNDIPELVLHQGENEFVFSGRGIINIANIGGRL